MAARTKIKSREIRLASRPQGKPTQDNFKLASSELDPARNGEFLVKNHWMSVDPYMRGRMNDGESYVQPFAIDQPLEGGCIGEVVESQNDQFTVGDYVLGNLGWREYWKSSGNGVTKIDPKLAPLQSYLGVLGMTGMTAWVGLKKIAKISSGSTVFVSAASGAVGSVACQIAKANDCRVIGSAGKPDKLRWLDEKTGVDGLINYKVTDDLTAKLRELTPDGIDVYFDNVGGDHLEAALDNLNNFGCIVACGMISTYNATDAPTAPRNLFKIIGKRIRMQGFIVRDHLAEQPEFVSEMSSLIRTGKIAWEETITEGLENAPAAFIGLFDGDNLGKALVKLQ